MSLDQAAAALDRALRESNSSSSRLPPQLPPPPPPPRYKQSTSSISRIRNFQGLQRCSDENSQFGFGRERGRSFNSSYSSGDRLHCVEVGSRRTFDAYYQRDDKNLHTFDDHNRRICFNVPENEFVRPDSKYIIRDAFLDEHVKGKGTVMKAMPKKDIFHSIPNFPFHHLVSSPYSTNGKSFFPYSERSAERKLKNYNARDDSGRVYSVKFQYVDDAPTKSLYGREEMPCAGIEYSPKRQHSACLPESALGRRDYFMTERNRTLTDCKRFSGKSFCSLRKSNVEPEQLNLGTHYGLRNSSGTVLRNRSNSVIPNSRSPKISSPEKPKVRANQTNVRTSLKPSLFKNIFADKSANKLNQTRTTQKSSINVAEICRNGISDVRTPDDTIIKKTDCHSKATKLTSNSVENGLTSKSVDMSTNKTCQNNYHSSTLKPNSATKMDLNLHSLPPTTTSVSKVSQRNPNGTGNLKTNSPGLSFVCGSASGLKVLHPITRRENSLKLDGRGSLSGVIEVQNETKTAKSEKTLQEIINGGTDEIRKNVVCRSETKSGLKPWAVPHLTGFNSNLNEFIDKQNKNCLSNNDNFAIQKDYSSIKSLSPENRSTSLFPLKEHSDTNSDNEFCLESSISQLKLPSVNLNASKAWNCSLTEHGNVKGSTNSAKNSIAKSRLSMLSLNGNSENILNCSTVACGNIAEYQMYSKIIGVDNLLLNSSQANVQRDSSSIFEDSEFNACCRSDRKNSSQLNSNKSNKIDKQNSFDPLNSNEKISLNGNYEIEANKPEYSKPDSITRNQSDSLENNTNKAFPLIGLEGCDTSIAEFSENVKDDCFMSSPKQSNSPIFFKEEDVDLSNSVYSSTSHNTSKCKVLRLNPNCSESSTESSGLSFQNSFVLASHSVGKSKRRARKMHLADDVGEKVHPVILNKRTNDCFKSESYDKNIDRSEMTPIRQISARAHIFRNRDSSDSLTVVETSANEHEAHFSIPNAIGDNYLKDFTETALCARANVDVTSSTFSMSPRSSSNSKTMCANNENGSQCEESNSTCTVIISNPAQSETSPDSLDIKVVVTEHLDSRSTETFQPTLINYTIASNTSLKPCFTEDLAICSIKNETNIKELSGSEDFHPLDPSKYKTELCRAYEIRGVCRYGTRCNYAHGLDQLKVSFHHGKYKTRNCQAYHETGYCRYGARCSFIHDLEEGILKCSIANKEILEALHYWPDQEYAPTATVTWKLFNRKTDGDPDAGLVEFTAIPSIKPADLGPDCDFDDGSTVSQIYTLDASRCMVHASYVSGRQNKKNLDSNGSKSVDANSTLTGLLYGLQSSNAKPNSILDKGRKLVSEECCSELRSTLFPDVHCKKEKRKTFTIRNCMNDLKSLMKVISPATNNNCLTSSERCGKNINNLSTSRVSAMIDVSKRFVKPLEKDSRISGKKSQVSREFDRSFKDAQFPLKMSGSKGKKCYSFHNKGFCLYGPNCLFVHD